VLSVEPCLRQDVAQLFFTHCYGVLIGFILLKGEEYEDLYELRVIVFEFIQPNLEPKELIKRLKP